MSDYAETRVSRRRLLRTGVNVGVGAALVWGFGADYASPDDLGTITYAVARREPNGHPLERRTRDVPVAWHESLLGALRAQETIRETGLSSLLGSFVVPGSYDNPVPSLSVDATSENVVEELETLVDDVALDVNVVGEIPDRPDGQFSLSEAYQTAELDGERIPGGVVCEGSEHYGTLSPALFAADSPSKFFATSNHLYDGTGAKETEHRGEPLSILYDDDAYRIGDVERGYPKADIVRVNPLDEYRPAPEIERASPSSVVGQYTKLGLADLMARDETLTKVGALSDHTTGPIRGIDGVTCYYGDLCRYGQLRWGSSDSSIAGDSGSVNFRADPENPDDYILIGGLNNASAWWPGGDFTWGTAGYHLLEEYGFHF